MVAQLSADEIAVGNYGIAANGMPFAVALEKKLFQQEGANVTGIISSQGGGTSIRNMLSGGVAYGEANPGVTAVAIQQGADLKIVSDNVLTVAEFVWAVKPDLDKVDQGLQGQEDRLHQSSLHQPGAGDPAAACGRLQVGGRGTRQNRRLRRGRCGARYSASIDVAPMTEPVWSKFKSKYRACRHSKRNPAAARQRRRRDDEALPPRAGRFHPCGDPRSPKGGRVHERQSR